MVLEKAVPLHPLSLKNKGDALKRKSSLKDLHKQRQVVQEASAL